MRHNDGYRHDTIDADTCDTMGADTITSATIRTQPSVLGIVAEHGWVVVGVRACQAVAVWRRCACSTCVDLTI